jgi:glutaredoxin
MKTLVEEDNRYYLTDTRANKTFVLRNYNAVKKMPHEYFHQKYKLTNNTNNSNNSNNSNTENKVWILYGRTSCPFCQESIRLLTNLIKKAKHKNDEFIFIDNENTKYTKNYILKELKGELNGHNTVPVIYCNGEFIGGNSDLHNYLGM